MLLRYKHMFIICALGGSGNTSLVYHFKDKFRLMTSFISPYKDVFTHFLKQGNGNRLSSLQGRGGL